MEENSDNDSSPKAEQPYVNFYDAAGREDEGGEG